MIRVLLTPEILLIEFKALDHRPHRSIEKKDSLGNSRRRVFSVLLICSLFLFVEPPRSSVTMPAPQRSLPGDCRCGPFFPGVGARQLMGDFSNSGIAEPLFNGTSSKPSRRWAICSRIHS